jgi:hypothetical protein
VGNLSGDEGISQLPLERQVFPRIYEGETLFSWCARFHRLTCNVNPRATCQQLFGYAQAGMRHDLPGNLNYFARVTGEALGPAEELLYQRTHFGLFAPFLSPQKKMEMVRGLCTAKHGVVRQGLGVARLGNDFTAQLKICDVCFEKDRLSVPTGLWHLDHQLLPVRVCLRHQRPLRLLTVEMTRYGLREWVLPEHFPVLPSGQVSFSERQLRILARIAHWTSFLVQRPDLSLQADLLRHVYMLKAMHHGWIAFDGSLRFADLCGVYLEYHAELIDQPGLGFLGEVSKVNGGFLGLLLRQYEGQRHPIKHIYLMAFLFDDQEEFLQMYQSASDLVAQDGKESLSRQLTCQRDRLMALITNEGKSVTTASREVGIAPTVAIRFLDKSGTQFERRPRVLTPELKQRLDEMLRRGDQRDEIAKALSIRKGFIKDYLALNVGLKTAWSAANRQRTAEQYREHFLQVLRDNPGVPIKRIRRISGNGFDWLYRNDCEWLEENLPGIWRRPDNL